MILVFIRTLVVYLMVTGAMRLMGKRQIGQLEVSELITTLLLSEIATLPIENPDVPLLYAVIPCVTLLTLEVCMAFVMSRHARLRHQMETPSSMLIKRGQIDQRELARNRMSVEELFAGLRQQGVGDPTEVLYAILEKNGQMSVILKGEYRPTTPKDLSLAGERGGMMHMMICDGEINEHNMTLLGRDEVWLQKVLGEYGVERDEVLYLLCDDNGETVLERKEPGV